MPRVRLSGTILGPQDPNREARARLLYLLFRDGWDIYNGNGDQRITLSNIERKIIEADGFMFTQAVTVEDLFKAVSVFVGYQTLDKNLATKPAVILNSDGTWTPLFELLMQLNSFGTISQDYSQFLLEAKDADAAVGRLTARLDQGVPDAGREHLHEPVGVVESFENPVPAGQIANVCVFCSATTRNEGYLEDGYWLGRELARHRLGCISGAGRSGCMGRVVEGAVEAGGWTAGSNVPHIIELEGLPTGLSSFWLRPDIYTRMEVMIENSDAFVIFPGGAGTLQEFLALMIFKASDHPLMKGKPVVVFNREERSGVGFWDKLLGLLHDMHGPERFTLVNRREDIIPTLLHRLEKQPGPLVGAPQV